MPKEDYLLKYLEKLSRVIAALAGFRDKGFPDDGLRLSEETFKEMLDLNLEELNQMPVELFVERVRKENFIPSYLQAFAQIMHETANSYSLKGNESTAQVFYIKTLQLYYLLNEKDRTFSFERELIITELNKIII